MAIPWGDLTPMPIAGAVLAMQVSIINLAGAAVDITGWQFEVWALNLTNTSTNDDQNWSAYVSVTNAPGGILTITVPRVLTKTYSKTKYQVDVCRIDSGNDAVVATGTLTFAQTSRPITE